MTAFPRRPAIAALPASLLAQLLYEQGSLEDAEELIRTRLPAIRMGGSIESALRAYPLLARIAARHGQRDYASAILKEAEDLAEQRGWNRLSAVIVAERASLLLDDGQVDEALACADALQRLAESGEVEASSSAFDIHRIWVLVQVRATLARTPSRSALDALRRLQHEAVRRREHYDALVLDIRLVEALAVVGEEAEALAVLIRALSFGSAVGVYQAFLDGGPRVETLLMRVYETTRMADDGPRELLPYLGSLVERRRAREIAPPLAPSKPLSGRILSERERNIVFWVSRGLSNKGIAKKLGITPETVKSHAKNIFIKLAVKTRAEAVSRAGDLGLM
jgi:ATP/maltotriose-dependent transcriptional regulator MalT